MRAIKAIILTAILLQAVSFAQIMEVTFSGRIDTFYLNSVDSITFKTSASPLTDIDGNVYKTVKIGNQRWMAENLKVTHYRDGTAAIPNVTDGTAWGLLATGAYCIYNNNAGNEVDTYGTLYNWYAVTDSRNIAPEGWHVPTDEEWKGLEIFLGMSQSEADDAANHRGTNEGSKLAGNADLWNSGNLESDSEFGTSGFTALPSGYRHYVGMYDSMGGTGYFWSATENITYSSYAWSRNLYYNFSGVTREIYDKRTGYPVRLLRD